MKSVLLTIWFPFLLFVVACGEQSATFRSDTPFPAASPTASPPPSEVRRPGGEGIDANMLRLGDPSEKTRAAAIDELVNKGIADKRMADEIASRSLNLLSPVCAETSEIIWDTDFRTLVSIGDLLAALKRQEALPALANCVNHRLGYGGMSYKNYPAISALAKFGPTALPALRERLQSGEPKSKCHIATAITLIGGSEARKILMAALINEKDKNVVDCIQRDLENSRLR